LPVRLEESAPRKDEFWRLFETTGWNDEYRLSPEEMLAAIESSCFCVATYAGDRLVGFGRVVSDKVVHAMIYDLIVIPEFQGAGIGERILARLVEWCIEAGIRDIQLFCAGGKREFYEKRGFQARPDDAPGMQYVHRSLPPVRSSCS
jgi:GNAT superfamily N-acetyltransferase